MSYIYNRRRVEKMELAYTSIAFSVVTLFIFYIVNSLVFGNNKKKLPPGPIGLPILGNLLSIGSRPHESLAKMAKTHGPLMTVQIGLNTTVVASSPEMAKEILQIHDQAFAGRPIPHAVTAQSSYQHSVAWQSPGSEWRMLRKLLNSQIFTNQRLDAMQELRHQVTGEMVKRVVKASEEEVAIDMGKLFFLTAVTLQSRTMFSGDMIDAESNTIDELKEAIEKIFLLIGKPNLCDSFPILKRLDPQGIWREMKVCYDEVIMLLEGVIDHRLKRRESGSFNKKGDFLDVLIDNSKLSEEGSHDLTRQQVRMILSDLLIGGTDTTTTTMEWAMTELIRNPRVMKKAKQELSEAIGSGRNVEEKDMSKLPYLQAIMKEIMRLHPTGPFLLPHRCETQVQVCGYTIPKGTRVIVNYWALAHDEKHWENPQEFEPERFLRMEFDFRGTNFSYIPFGSGRRICPGLSLAMRMMYLILGSLIHRFDWKLPDGIEGKDIDIEDKFGGTLKKAKPLVAIPLFVK